jgi:hypothetical protein
VCRDLQTDRANCGACGTTCATGEVCSGGVCAPTCGGGQVFCAGACRDVQTDRAHCGACGTRCVAGQVCNQARCQTVALPFPARFFPQTVGGTQGGYNDLAFDGTGNLLVGTQSGTIVSVSRVDGSQRTVASGIPGPVLSVAFHAARNTIYAINGSNLYAVNPNTGASSVVVAIPAPDAIAVVPAGFGAFGDFIAVVGRFSELRMVNPASGAVTNFATVNDGSDIAFTPSNTAVVVNGTSVRIVTATGAVSTLFTGSGVSFDGVAVDTVRNLYYLADSSGDRLFSLPFAGGVSTPLGSYDYDSGFYVAGMVFDGVDTLLMATGESSLTIVARSPLP